MNHGPNEHYARPRDLLAAAIRALPVSLALVMCALTAARAGSEGGRPGHEGARGPEGANVVSGSARVYNQGTTNVTVDQYSQNAIINWHTFNVAPDGRIRFDQPNSSSVILNRVTGGLGPSEILGRLDANGRVFVVNRDGFIFGAGAVINTAGFLATTSDISNKDFMDGRYTGRYNFNIRGHSDASIVNMGTITASNGGFAGLVAPGVRNSGTITANLGTVVLGAGNIFTLDMYGDSLIKLSVNDQIAGTVKDAYTHETLKSLVTNTGKLQANGGRVELTAAAARQVVDSVINTSGVIEANSVGMRDGQIILGAATASSKREEFPTRTVKISGTLSAAGKYRNTKGGTILVNGEDIQVKGATIDASGRAGGGTVVIGAGLTAGHTESSLVSNESSKREGYTFATASRVSIDSKTKIDVSAKDRGNGGVVALLSEQNTSFAGTILALGGAKFGNGGFVAAASFGTLNYAGKADTRAPMGATGNLLLIAPNFTVWNGTGAAPAGSSILNTTLQAQLETSNVALTALGGQRNGDILVNAGLSWVNANTLSLIAGRDIALNAPIVTIGGELSLAAQRSITATDTVDVASFVLRYGDWSQVSASLPVFVAKDFRLEGGSFLRALGGDGSTDKPYQLADVYGLQGVGSSPTLLGQNFALANDIDASGTANWNGGAGFRPIGDSSLAFGGTFDGQSHTIDKLQINSTASYSGLFGYIGASGVVHDVGLTNASVTGSQSDGNGWVGTLAGFNAGVITRSYATGSATAADSYDIGGLVGRNVGTISQSYADVATTGGADSAIGGLAGRNEGTIEDSYARGAVVATSGYAGGLIGWNLAGSVTRTYATGLVSTSVAGLVSAASESAGGLTATGGLIGKLDGGTVTNSYWDTQTTGQSTSAAGTPQTTAELTSAIPAGFDPKIWAAPVGQYPCLASTCNPPPTQTPTQTPDPTQTPVQTPDPIVTPVPDPAPQQPADTTRAPKGTPVTSPQLVVAANLVFYPTGPQSNGDPTPNTTLITNPPPGPSGGQGGGQNGGRPSGNHVPPPGLGPLPSGMPPLNETRFLSNEVVMQLGTTVTPEALAALARSLGLEIISQQNFEVLGRTVFRFRIAGNLSVRDVIKAIELNHVNVSAQPSYTYALTRDVTQTVLAQAELAQADLAQADLAGAPADTRRNGDAAQYVVDKLHLAEAHTIATGKNVKVAVIDSEIDANHPDLQGVITATYDALPSSDQSPHPHGTGMAGAIASHRRLLGVAPGAKLLAVRAFGIDEKGAQGTSMNIVKGLEWAVAQGATIINMSFAGPRDPILQQAIKKLSDDGIILIAAAGNAGPKSPPLFPGADANVIAVSATDVDDKVFKNANRGKYIAIAAPGVDILVPAPDGGYQLTTGTSVAAAHISGVVALLKERNPQLKSADVRNILSASAKNIGPVKTDIGAGLVDPVQALTRMGSGAVAVR